MHFNTQAFKHFSWAFLALIVLGSPLLFMEKEFLNLWLNRHHNPFLDGFFKYITYLGSGWALLLLLLFVLSRNYFLSLVLALSVFFEFLFVQIILKHGLFDDIVRPIKYIAQSELLHKVEGINIYSLNSFPSGHSQTAFLIFTFLAVFCRRKSIVYILLFIALMIGLSRVYLLQHFFIDVWVGSIIGYTFPLFISFILYKYSNLSNDSKWQRGFLSWNRK